MLSKLLGGLVRRAVTPLGKALAGLGLTPNMVTVFGTLVVAAGCVLVAAGSRSGGGIVILAGCLSDLIDGAIARGGGKATKAGAFLDSTLDRLSDGLVFVAIAWSASFPGVLNITFGPMPQERWPLSAPAIAGLSLAALMLGFMTSYIKARAEGLGMSCEVGVIERPERMMLAGAGLVFGLTSGALVFLVALSAVTVVQRFTHTWRQAHHHN